FNSYPKCVASTNTDSSSIVQVSRACPKDQQKWAQSGTVAITAADECIGSNTLNECKKKCKDTNDCVAVKYNPNVSSSVCQTGSGIEPKQAEKCAILWEPIAYGSVRIADNEKIGEAVLHVPNCKVGISQFAYSDCSLFVFYKN
ncbi:hypothetical protein EG68_10890, partial [Paragonimus skrjabini miyazakii]